MQGVDSKARARRLPGGASRKEPTQNRKTGVASGAGQVNFAHLHNMSSDGKRNDALEAPQEFAPLPRTQRFAAARDEADFPRPSLKSPESDPEKQTRISEATVMALNGPLPCSSAGEE
jgi:hypothetical protein